MFKITKRAEYGLIAVACLAREPGQILSVQKISERHTLPKRLLAEVLKGLARHGIVRATRGAAGGYSIAREPADTSLASVITALEGPLELSDCNVGGGRDGKCTLQQNCCIKDPVSRIYAGIRDLLEGMNVADLLEANGSMVIEPTNGTGDTLNQIYSSTNARVDLRQGHHAPNCSQFIPRQTN